MYQMHQKIERFDSEAMETDRKWSDVERSERSRTIKDNNSKRRRRRWVFPRCSCMKSGDDYPAVTEPSVDGSFNVQAAAADRSRSPTHLVVMVNGIYGSADNWRYAAKQFVKAYPQDVIVHCSRANSSLLTFHGVDVMGKRLADEVLSVIQQHPSLQKISFIGHSLGGLVTRYAIAKLYKQDFPAKTSEENQDSKHNGSKETSFEDKSTGKVAGLEPVNFVTFATPHLGSRGHKQVPVFCGFYGLEKAASSTSWVLGRSGQHLFLTDNDNDKPPLLLQMATDSENLPFISALKSFKRRVAYANVRFDQLVGWSTSSLRLRNELPKRGNLMKNGKYPHIVNEEMANEVDGSDGNSLEVKIDSFKIGDMEEVMLKGLRKVSWERVDVYFSGGLQKYFAHNTIQVQDYWAHSDGADVIQHMIDNFLL